MITLVIYIYIYIYVLFSFLAAIMNQIKPVSLLKTFFLLSFIHRCYK